MSNAADIAARVSVNEPAIRAALTRVGGVVQIAVASDLAEEHARRLRLEGRIVEVRPFTGGPFDLKELRIY